MIDLHFVTILAAVSNRAVRATVEYPYLDLASPHVRHESFRFVSTMYRLHNEREAPVQVHALDVQPRRFSELVHVRLPSASFQGPKVPLSFCLCISSRVRGGQSRLLDSHNIDKD